MRKKVKDRAAMRQRKYERRKREQAWRDASFAQFLNELELRFLYGDRVTPTPVGLRSS